MKRKKSARGKKYLEAKKKIENTKFYSPTEAVALVKQTATAKFGGSVEMHARLGIDTKKGEQNVRATIVLPFSTRSSKRITAFVSEAKEKDAREAGADVVGGEALIEEIIKTQKIDFDVAVATPDMMPKLAKVAKILGPKGLMPNPKTDTVGADIGRIISELKKGKIAFKNDDTANVHLTIGKVSQPETELLANFTSCVEAIRKAKPQSSKGTYLKSIYLTSTMGPSVKVIVSG